MIVSREECRILSEFFHSVQWVLDDTPEPVAAIIARLAAEAAKADAVPAGALRGADGIIRPDPRKDDTIRKGDTVWQSNNPGAKVADLFRNDKNIIGIVKMTATNRVYVEYPESDALPLGYSGWIDRKHLTKGKPPE